MIAHRALVCVKRPVSVIGTTLNLRAADELLTRAVVRMPLKIRPVAPLSGHRPLKRLSIEPRLGFHRIVEGLTWHTRDCGRYLGIELEQLSQCIGVGRTITPFGELLDPNSRDMDQLVCDSP
jgi:hypothetical protein